MKLSSPKPTAFGGTGTVNYFGFYPSSLSNQTNSWQNPFLCEKKIKSSNFHVEKVYGKNQLKLPENRQQPR